MILPADQAPEPEEETPRAMAPPRAADALPKGAMASKPSLRTGEARAEVHRTISVVGGEGDMRSRWR